MNTTEKLAKIKAVAEEIVSEEELIEILKKKKPIAYDGYEPSGQLHIAQGILVPHILNTFVECGFHVKFFLADWHAQANNKMGGDLEKIQNVGRYMKEVLLAAGLSKEIEFVWASDLQKSPTYWQNVVKVSMQNSVKRIERCAEIMGRSEGNLQSSQILYPLMQCVDIFEIGADVIAMGMDQRKVNMLAREVAPKVGWTKPVAVHHRMLMGLTEPKTEATGVEGAIAKKMSKSNPNSAIFMNDSAKDVEKKFNKAYCPEGQVADNPVLEYLQFIIFPKFGKIAIERPDKYGGNVSFDSYADLEEAFVAKQIHPVDIKQAAAKYINQLLEPVRKHCEKGKAKELLELIQSYTVTR